MQHAGGTAGSIDVLVSRLEGHDDLHAQTVAALQQQLEAAKQQALIVSQALEQQLGRYNHYGCRAGGGGGGT